MIGLIHLDARLTVPLAIIIAGALILYWKRLGVEGVPAGRRRIRRVSVLVTVLALPHFVRGLSYLDPEVDQLEYVIAWSAAMLSILFVFITACLDALLTLRLLRRAAQRTADHAVDELLETRRATADDADRSS